MPGRLIAVYVHADIALAGICIPAHRTLEVVGEPRVFEPGEERNVLSAGEARALVQAGYATAIEADFRELERLIDDWQRA